MDESSSDEAILVVFTLDDGLYGVKVETGSPI
jgi:hypothetical protein